MLFPLPNNGKKYPSLDVEKLLKAQPLTGPVGLVYYFKFQYEQNKAKREKLKAEHAALIEPGVAKIISKYPWLRKKT